MERELSDLLQNTKGGDMIKRSQRKALLKAFDIYKTNVQYGIVDDSQREAVLYWYQAILELEDWAFESDNIPSNIRKYL